MLAAVCTGPLFAAWGGPDPQPRRTEALDPELARLAVLAADPDVAVAYGAGAVTALRQGPAAAAFSLGQQVIALLDQHSRRLPLGLLREAADAALTSGDGPAGEALLDRAVQQAQAGDEQGSSPLDQARVLAEQGRHLIARDPGQAGQLLERACQLFTQAGSEGEAAAATGTLADIAYQRGDYDEALRIRREIELPVYERLGETQSAAITWGQIADITYQRGDYDQAADLQHKRLEANQQLGDLDGIAAASWDLAQIYLARQDYQSAFPRLAESFQLFSRLQRPDGIAAVGSALGQLLITAGDPGQARQVLQASLAAATTIGWADAAQHLTGLLNELPDDKDQP